jgi:hypothetical protein
MIKQRTNGITTTLGSFNFFSPTHPPPAGDREANLGLVFWNIVKSLEQRDFTIFFYMTLSTWPWWIPWHGLVGGGLLTTDDYLSKKVYSLGL